MQEPFPTLTDLDLGFTDELASVVPDSFLRGSAPRLQRLFLDSVPFPGLPRLLSSASDLVILSLWHIPHSGYISPGAMANCLSTLTRLEFLLLDFKSSPPRSLPDLGSPPPPPTRAVHPSLTRLSFSGVSKYLEDLMSRIDAPRLDDLDITFFFQLSFDTPQLAQFISRTPQLNVRDKAYVAFSSLGAFFSLPRTYDRRLELKISCRQSDWQVLSMTQVCNSILPFFSAFEHLYITKPVTSLRPWPGDIENSEWLELLQPFTAAKNL